MTSLKPVIELIRKFLIRQITDISDLLLLFDEFLFLTFASLQSDDFFSETFKTSSKQKAL